MVIALYMRLSKEDTFLQQESNSISCQRIMLKEYVKEHFKEYELLEFVDDGYSGLHFNRPNIVKLLEYTRKKLVDCIIVKDFSRFSRDYIELGSYIEQIFPFMGVRFISVNDHYDSKQTQGGIGNIDISFKTLLYDLYSKDISIKVKTSLNARKEKGEYISANSPFGYEKDKENKHMLLIEQNEADIVRRIFDMALNGYTSVQIARQFNEEGIKTPIQFKLEKNKTKSNKEIFEWNSSTICHILKNEIYVGDVVYGKYYKKEVGGKAYLKPKSDWRVYRNHHQPIVTREIFESVQKNKRKTRACSNKENHFLTGKLVCNCGRKLQLKKGINPYFRCPHMYVTAHFNCIKEINVMFLEEYVLFEIQQHILHIINEKNQKEDNHFMKYLGITKLNKELVSALIEKIFVYEEFDIEIIWKIKSFN